jgi:thiol peroxidase
MATITLKGNPIHTAGDLPAVGGPAPEFTLTGGDLAEQSLAALRGRTVILNIVPSLDTGICALSAKRFNEEAGRLPNTVILNVSMDLPFAQKRFCDAEKLAHIQNLSGFRAPGFGQAYGVRIVDGPLAGLYSRAVVVVDAAGVVRHAQQVPEIVQEPDYDAVLQAARATAS